MQLKKLPMLTVAAAGVIALAAAPDAKACENCVGDGNGGEMCWSGWYAGYYGSCWEEAPANPEDGDICHGEGSCDYQDPDYDGPADYYCWRYSWCPAE